MALPCRVRSTSTSIPRKTSQNNKSPHQDAFCNKSQRRRSKKIFQVELGAHPDAVSRLAKEGIERREDLIEFASANIKTVAGNLRRPGGRAPNESIEGRIVPNQPFTFGTKAELRLENDVEIMNHFETLEFQAIPDMLVHEPTTKNFKLE